MEEVCATCGQNPLDEDDECITVDFWDTERLVFCDVDCLHQWTLTHERDGKLRQG